MMQKIPLFKFKRKDGGVTVSPKKPENTDFEEAVRLIAEEGKTLTNDGINFTQCVDVASAEGWEEIDETTIFGKGEFET